MATSSLAVTGSTGALGSLIARNLSNRGFPQRLLVRDPSRAPHLDHTTIHQAGYSDHDAIVDALSGIKTVLMVSAAENLRRLEEHIAFIDAAVAAGVTHIVYTSFAAAAPDATFTLARDHHFTEQHIIDAGIGFTFLRDNFYMDLMELMVGEDGAIRGPAGSGRVSIVARTDVAAVATEVLSAPTAHVARTYTLTGPEALTLDEVATAITDVRGRTIRFHDETLDEAHASRAPYGAPDWQVDAWVSTYTAIASGALSPVTDDVRRLTGRAPLTFAQFLRGS